MNFIFIVINSILLFVIGFIFDKIMVAKGIIRERSRWQILLLAVFATLAKEIWFVELPWIYFIIIGTLGITLSLNQADLWTSSQKGAWWWKGE